jgi:hypothetical protein
MTINGKQVANERNGGWGRGLVAPFPYFGGKRRVAAEVWRRFGTVRSYVEPFFGSGAVLLGRPAPFAGVESVNDADGLLCNFWRAVQSEPETVAHHADWPVNEADLHARHLWLVGQRADLTARLMGDPDWYDAKAAGWWVWGACAWIGSGWCSGEGGWVRDADGCLVQGEGGVARQRPHLGGSGCGQGINRQLPHLYAGRGINRQLPHLYAGQGINRQGVAIREWFGELADRLRGVRVCCGDWSRVTGDSVTWRHGLTGVFLDPPYAVEADRHMGVYGATDSGTVAHDVRGWAIEAGKRPDMRIAVCGYNEHDDLAAAGWVAHRWKTGGSYGMQGNGQGRANQHREVIWFSPGCIGARQPDLFGGAL